MAYLKPPWFTAKIFNKIAMATGVGNSETLTVTKRVSKQPQQIPVVVPEVDGVKYLVSTRGETEWVKNVRADPNVKVGDHEVRRHGDSGRAAGARSSRCTGRWPARSSRATGASCPTTPTTRCSRSPRRADHYTL